MVPTSATKLWPRQRTSAGFHELKYTELTMGDSLIAVIIWLIVILGVAAVAYWANRTYAPATFRRPIAIVITIVAGILLVYLLGGLLIRLVPAFPG